jgi:hypothetical protein
MPTAKTLTAETLEELAAAYGVIEEVTHARFLGERVALGNAVRV